MLATYGASSARNGLSVGGATKGKDLILVGSRAPLTLDRLGERMNDSRISAELNRIGLRRASDVESWYVCDETTLAPALIGAIINTDDNMLIENRAPREAFLPLMEANAAWIEALGKGIKAKGASEDKAEALNY